MKSRAKYGSVKIDRYDWRRDRARKLLVLQLVLAGLFGFATAGFLIFAEDLFKYL